MFVEDWCELAVYLLRIDPVPFVRISRIFISFEEE